MRFYGQSFLVTTGSYSDYGVVGVCSTMEKAEELKKLTAADNDIEEMILDKFPDHPTGHYWYEVTMDGKGNTTRIISEDCISINNKTNHEEWWPYGGGCHCPACRTSPNTLSLDESMIFRMWAKDENHAIKIANERRIRLIETNSWGFDWEDWKENQI